MAQRISAAELARLLNSASQPIYVLDEDLTVVFINRACQEWLGPAAEGLLGRRCGFIEISGPATVGADAVAAGLCPPPRVTTGEPVAAAVARVAEESGTLTERSARFLPLGGAGEDVLGIIALVDSADQPPASVGDDGLGAPDTVAGPVSTETAEADAIALHEQVRRFRQEAAARYWADRLIGRRPEMQLARRQVKLAAASRCSVLLVGPPGSGRQHLAAAIHYASKSAVAGDLDRIADAAGLLAVRRRPVRGRDRVRRPCKRGERAGRLKHASPASGR